MQYIACQFRKGEGQSYTYSNPGDPVKVGDEVKVESKGADGWKRVYVSAVGVPKPTQFEAKPILGIAPPKDD